LRLGAFARRKKIRRGGQAGFALRKKNSAQSREGAKK
jgi:hypothetical protein